MSFFNIPMYYEPTPSRNNVYAQQQQGTIPRYLNGYVPTQVNYQEPSVQFKVYAFEKLNGNGKLNFGDASTVYRFELIQNRSFGGFLNVLKNNGISAQTHKFYYVDDEQDLVVLSTEYDFKYMLKIMKGKTIKIVGEKIAQPSVCQRSCPRASGSAGFRNLPFFKFEKKEEKDELIDSAFDSVFSELLQNQAQQVFRPQCNNQRVRTIRLSDLLKQAQKEEPKKEEKKEEKQTRSFEDYLAELFGKKLAERKQKEEEAKKEESKLEKAVPEQQESSVDEEKKESVEESQQVEEEKKEQTPILSTSQIISNYLIGEEEEDIVTDEEDEEDSEDDQSSVASEPVNQTEVEYPTVTNPEEQTVEEEQPSYENELKLLVDMGFSDESENLRLLNKYSGDVQRAVSELVYYF